ncbi:helix-turn-helix transcriptional regulator [Nonomuraea typhae]|uniref:Helix-turn-helix transcriptional regulator n=1 Tax=Nonomuraea typhae TaxID=2603600 RepID=A0ABW7YUG2_9ACTN
METFDGVRHRLPYEEVTAIDLDAAQRELLLARTRGGEHHDDDPRTFAGAPGSLPLPQPSGRIAVAVARELVRNPNDPRTAAEWAHSLHTSSTSLRRAFREETGLAFSEWRTRLRLNRSLELLERGHMVGSVAARVGFASANGYIEAFKRHFGRTPGAHARRSA